MAGEMCVLIPTINRRKSQLYQDIYNYTGKNRPLTNLLYAAAHTEELKGKFDKNDINNQGEIKFESLRKFLDLDSYLDSETLLQEDRKAIGAIDATGKEVGYANPDIIKERVLEYNDTHDKFHAKIDYRDGKYYIDLDVIDGTNFKTNAIIRDLEARFNAFQQFLSDNDINVTWSAGIKNSVANFRNYRVMKSIITSAKGGRKGIENMSDTKSQIILEMLVAKGNRNAERFVSKFGPKAAEYLADVSANRSLDIPGLSPSDTAYWEGIAHNVLNGAIDMFRGLDMDDLNDYEERALAGVTPNEEKVFGVDMLTVDDMLDELDQQFHLKQDFIEEAGKRVKSLSEAAQKFFMTTLRETELRKRKGEKTKNVERMLKINRSRLNNGEYAESISHFLSNVYNQFKRLEKQIAQIRAEVNESDEVLDDAQVINEYSSVVLDILNRVQAYGSVVRELMNPRNLKLDQEYLPSGLLDDIQNTAIALNKLINNAESVARGAQANLVYAFLKLYWGEEDVKVVNGEERSLASIVQTLSHDVNIVEKLFLSMNASTDEALGLFYEAVKTTQRTRDAVLKRADYIIRTATDRLYKAGKSSSSVFIYKDGKPTDYMRSEFDFEKYKEAKAAKRKELHDSGLRGEKLTDAMAAWEKENLEKEKAFSDKNLEDFRRYIGEYLETLYDSPATDDEIDEYIPIALYPKKEFYEAENAKTLGMDDVLREYYLRMMALKAIVSMPLPPMSGDFFRTIQLSTDLAERVSKAGIDPKAQFEAFKEAFVSAYTIREDDTEFGDTFNDLLAGNNIRSVATDMKGMELMRLPLYFTHKLNDGRQVTTNLSRAMSAFTASAVNYGLMQDIFDSLMLTQDYLTTQREFEKSSGPRTLAGFLKQGKDTYVTKVKEDIAKSSSADWLNQFSESNVFNRRRRGTGEFILFDNPVSLNKAVDTVTMFTSISGLTVNFFGAEANLLVGKLQMFIESMCKEFYDVKNWMNGEVSYAKYLPEYLGEISSNNKKSFLALLGEYFDVQEDYFETMKNAGFKESAIGKILDNAELMFLYGAGEHMLHHVTMFAILDNVKVWDKVTKTEVPALKLFEVKKDDSGKNGYITVNKDRYEWIERDKDGKRASTRPVEDDDIDKMEKQITYCNKTMHGAFNAIDKGTIHRYAIGRLFMNFRQWMPEHYARRFNKLHYDADLGEYRRGYYISLYTFLWNAVGGLVKNKTSIATSWDSLSKMDQYNVKRAIAEVEAMLVLAVGNLALGTYKDKKGNWAYRNLMYQVKRMLMETQASSLAFIPFLTDPWGIVTNAITMLNSPFAALNTIEKLKDTLNLLDLFDTIEGGKYDGENRYLHNLEKNMLFVGQIKKQLEFNDDMFYIFKEK